MACLRARRLAVGVGLVGSDRAAITGTLARGDTHLPHGRPRFAAALSP